MLLTWSKHSCCRQMCRQQFMKSQIEDVSIKGTGLRTKLDVRRVWKCSQCDRVVKLRGQETSKTCNCRGETWFMELQEEQRWTRPHQPIKSVPEVRPDPDEFPDPPKQELPVDPETSQAVAETIDSPGSDVETTEASFGEGIESKAAEPEPEPLVRSSLRSLTEMLNDDDDDEDDDLGSEISAESPASESEDKPRTGRKRRRRRRRRKGGPGGDTPSGQSGSTNEPAGSENTIAESAAAQGDSGSNAPKADGTPKKKRRRRRRRRKKPEGGSTE